MKSLKSMFVSSARELKDVRAVVVTGMLIAVSMAIETYTIEIPFSKISFAFIAIAIIGMLFGPTVGLLAGGSCDVVGYLVHPMGGFLPIFTFIGMLQGLIYGIILYTKRDKYSIILLRNSDKKQSDITLFIRAILARLLDVVLINLILNTWALKHYNFISEASYPVAIVNRIAKNITELVIDIPLMFILFPAVLVAYNRVFKKSSVIA